MAPRLRLLLLLLCGLGAQAAAAQDSPVGNRPDLDPAVFAATRGEVVADTTEPWRYFPLEVGNSWEYAQWVYLRSSDFVVRHFVEKDTTISDVTYYILNINHVFPDGSVSTPLRYPLRYDTLSAQVMRPAFGGDTPHVWCPLDLDFGLEEYPCFHGPHAISGGYDRLLVFPRDDAPGDSIYTAVKRFFNYISFEQRFGADFGLVYEFCHACGVGMSLQAARLGGWEGTVYGELRHPPNPVSSEGSPARGSSLAVEGWPNPFRERVTVAFTLGEAAPVVVELVDVLGRVVVRRDLGVLAAGEHREAVGASALAPGPYVVRVRRGGEVAVSRVLTAVR